MIAIVWIAVGMTALIRPSKAWSLVLPFVLLSLDLTAILGVVLRRGLRRAYWLGFALFGWVYLILLVYLLSGGAPLFSSSTPESFINDALEGWIELFAIPGLIVEPGNELVKVGQIADDLRKLTVVVDDESRLVVACCMAGLAFSALGGKIARKLGQNEASAAGPNPAIRAAARSTSAAEPPN